MRQKDPLRLLSISERRALEQLARSHSAPALSVSRARALLAVSDGCSYTEAAHLVGRSVGDSIAVWVARFNHVGLAAVEVIAEGSPERTVVGFAEQEMVGGFFTGSFTVKLAEHCAIFFLLSVICAVTV